MKSHSLEEPNVLQELRNNPTSRRAFLKTMGAAGLGLAALDGCGGGNDDNNGGGNGNLPAALQQFPGTGDQKILNYALTLELLEADLYRQALNIAAGVANPATAPLSTNSASYTRKVGGGGLDSFNTEAGFNYLRDFAYVEDAHVKFLQANLGATAVAKNAKGYTFGTTVASDIKSILTAILPLEETGVRAYLGAGQYFQSLPLLQTALTIYSTEARHSSAINYILGKDPGPTLMTGDSRVQTFGSSNTFEYFLTPDTVVKRVKQFFL